MENSAKEYPDKTAIIFEGKKTTYKELNVLTDKLATALFDLGLKKGDKLSLYMANCPEFVVGFYGGLKAGATITTMNPMYKEREVKYQLDDSEATAIIVEDLLFPVVNDTQSRRRGLKVIVTGNRRCLNTYLFKGLIKDYTPKPPEVKLDVKKDLAVMPYTSGTTGQPKGVMLTHYNLVVNAIQNSYAYNITKRDIFLNHLPFYHIYGMTVSMNAPIYQGATQIIMRRYDVDSLLKLIEKYRATVMFTVPPVIIDLVNYQNLQKYDLSSLRLINSGGAPLPTSVACRLEKLTGVTVIHAYGLTEASPTTHVNPPNRVKLESIGPPLSDTEHKVVDIKTELEVLPPGEVGELVVKGPQVMRGYWKNVEDTEKTIKNGWLYTGDIGKIDEENYAYIVDRKKEIIKYKGYTVGPAELEAILLEHKAVADCAVIGKPEPVAGEIPKAFVVLKKGEKATEAEIIDFVKGRISAYKRIREVEFVKRIPKTLSGKILRRVFIEKEREIAS